MKRVLSIFLILAFSINSFAVPFQNNELQVIYADNGQCNFSIKQFNCSEMDLNSTNSGVCDTSKYQGFVSINNKTFAVTKQAVAFDSVSNKAKITNDLENLVIADMLKYLKINQAFIGGLDKKRSTEYNSTDINRFKWFDDSPIIYSNFDINEPNNYFSSDMVGVSLIYGEHWLAIDSSGKWADVGDKNLYSVVEFKGNLSCVSGRVKQTGSNITEDYYACANGANEFGATVLEKCDEGIIFDTSQVDYICKATKEACLKSEIIIGYEDNVTETEKEEIVEEVFDLELPFGTTANLYRNNELFKLLENKPMLINTYCYEFSGSSDAGGFQWVPCTNTINRNKVITFDEPFYNCTTGDGESCAWNMVKPAIKTLTTSSSVNLNVVDNKGVVHATWQEKTPFQTFCWQWVGNNDSGGNTFVPCVKEVIDDLQWSFTPTLAGEFISSALVGSQFVVKVLKKITDTTITKVPIYKTTYTCPSTNRPCIESSGNYFCSSACVNGNINGGNVTQDPSVEGGNDVNNDGKVEPDGTCLGEWKFFPGRDSRCRLPGLQTKYYQCCRTIPLADKDKKDISLKKEEVLTGMAAAAAITTIVLQAAFPFWLFLLATDVDFNVCTGSERQLSINRTQELCVYVGNYCSEQWFGTGCVQKKDTYCCFDSEFSKAFNEAGYDLLKKYWGVPQTPNCGGFSPDELQILSSMNIADHPKMRTFGEQLGSKFQDKMINEFNKNLDIDAIQNDVKNFDIGNVLEGVK